MNEWNKHTNSLIKKKYFNDRSTTLCMYSTLLYYNTQIDINLKFEAYTQIYITCSQREKSEMHQYVFTYFQPPPTPFKLADIM